MAGRQRSRRPRPSTRSRPTLRQQRAGQLNLLNFIRSNRTQKPKKPQLPLADADDVRFRLTGIELTELGKTLISLFRQGSGSLTYSEGRVSYNIDFTVSTQIRNKLDRVAANSAQ